MYTKYRCREIGFKYIHGVQIKMYFIIKYTTLIMKINIGI